MTEPPRYRVLPEGTGGCTRRSCRCLAGLSAAVNRWLSGVPRPDPGVTYGARWKAARAAAARGRR